MKKIFFRKGNGSQPEVEITMRGEDAFLVRQFEKQGFVEVTEVAIVAEPVPQEEAPEPTIEKPKRKKKATS